MLLIVVSCLIYSTISLIVNTSSRTPMSWPSLTSNSRRMACLTKTLSWKTWEFKSQSLCSSKLTSEVVPFPISQPRKIQIHHCLLQSSVKRMGYLKQLLILSALESSHTSIHTMEKALRASHGRYIRNLSHLAKNSLSLSRIKVKKRIPLRKQVCFWINPRENLVPVMRVIKIILRETRSKEAAINLKHNSLHYTALPGVRSGLWQVSTRVKPSRSTTWSRPRSRSILTPLW